MKSNVLEAVLSVIDLGGDINHLELINAAITPYKQQWSDILLSEFSDSVEFAAKGQRQCKKGYSCGSTCIARNRKCRKKHDEGAKEAQDWLKGNGALSDSDASQLEKLIDEPTPTQPATGGGGNDEPQQESAPEEQTGSESQSTQESQADSSSEPQFLSEQQAFEQYEVLGSGIEGTVFKDPGPPPRAIKYTSRASESDLAAFDEETRQRFVAEQDALYAKSLSGVTKAGELGIAPKVYETGEADRGNGKSNVLSMELLDGYSLGIHPSSGEDDDIFDIDSTPDTRPYETSFIQKLKVAHDNNLIVADLHEENVMVNGDTKDVKFIDQGGIEEGTAQQKAAQLLDKFSSRPLAAETIERFVNQHGSTKQKRAFSKIQRSFEGADNLSNDEYSKMSSDLYRILGELGV